MATKINNRLTFYGDGYGYVQLVRRSVAYKLFCGEWYNHFTRCYELKRFWYWQGQLVNDWEGENTATGEKWGRFYKGQIVWLNADLFHQEITI